jgi:hypothetical protein
MRLRVEPGGVVRCLYSEAIDLSRLGAASIRRASNVEPDEHGRWWADLALVKGPRLGPFVLRSQALDAEQSWLEAHWFSTASTPSPRP